MRIALFLRNLDEEFQITIYRGIRAQALARGIDLVCVQGETVHDDLTGDRTRRPFGLASAVRFDGILVLSPVIADQNDRFLGTYLRTFQPGLPCISVGMKVPGIPSVAIKSRRSLTRVLEHLILDHGYRRFLFVGGPKAHRDSRSREQVFRRTLKNFQTSCPGLEGTVEYGNFTDYAASNLFRSLLDGPPYDAVVAANDNMALGIQRVLRVEAGPRWARCAVTGFDDVPQASLEIPPLTSVHQPLEELGARALDTVIDLVEGRKVPGYRSISSWPVIRESCGCLPPAPPEFSIPGALMDSSAAAARWEDARRQAVASEEWMRSSNYLGRDLSAVEDHTLVWNHLDHYLATLGIADFSLLSSPRGGSDPLVGTRLVFERRGGVRTVIHEGGLALEPEALFDSFAGPGHPPHDLILAHLRSGRSHLGVAVYSGQAGSHPHLGAVLPHVANAMKRLGDMEEQRDRNKVLERMVRARTADLVQANQRLVRQRVLLETILRTLPIPVVLFETASGLILYANRAFEDAVEGGGTARSIRVFLDIPPVCEGVELALRSGRGDGRVLPVLVYTAALDYDGREATLAGMVDQSRQRALEAEVLQISEFERRRFGLDLHDDICQRLAGIAMYLRGFRSRPPQDPPQVLAEVGGLVDETLQLTRQYAHASFPIDLERRGLDSVLRTLCETVEAQSGRSCRYEGRWGPNTPQSSPALHIYRIVQEALHNAVKHAQAKHLEVRVEGDGGEWCLRVRDDGKGLAPEEDQAGEGLGLRSMAYRAAQLGARLSLENRPEGGTEVVLRVPQGR